MSSLVSLCALVALTSCAVRTLPPARTNPPAASTPTAKPASPLPQVVTPTPEPSAAPTAPPSSPVVSPPGFVPWASAESAEELPPTDAVAKDEAELEQRYVTLPELGPPELLAQATLRRTLPRSFLTEHDQHLSALMLLGMFVDQNENRFVLHASYAGFDSALVVLDGKGQALAALHVPNRCTVYLRDVLGDETLEVMVARVEGTALSTWPVTWAIYRLSTSGRLHLVLEHPKSLSTGSKQRHFTFLNAFDFDEHERLRVVTTHSDFSSEAERREAEALGEPSHRQSPLLGQSVTFVFEPHSGRYRRTGP